MNKFYYIIDGTEDFFMKLLHHSYLSIINDEIKDKAFQYYENKAILYIDVSEDYAHRYWYVQGAIDTEYGDCYCSFTINRQNKKIKDAQCDCKEEESSRIACVHIGALIVYMTQEDIRMLPYVYKSEEFEDAEEDTTGIFVRSRYDGHLDVNLEKTHQLIQSQKAKYQVQMQLETQFEDVHLLPELEYNDATSFLLSFRIGNTKKYVLKDYHEFLHCLKTNESHSYGKCLTFVHHWSCFDETSQSYIRFMSKYENQEYKSQRYILIDETNIDDFVDTFKEANIFELTEEAISLPLDIEEKNDFYRITNIGHPFDAKTKQNFYTFDHAPCQIHKYQLDAYGHMYTLYSNFKDNRIFVSKDDYEDFYHYCILPNYKYIEIKDMDVLPPIAKQEIIHVDIYGDLGKKETLEFNAIGYTESKQQMELISNEEYPQNFTTELITTVLNNYASEYNKEDHKAYMNLAFDSTFDFINQGLERLRPYCDIYVSDSLKKIGKATRYRMVAGVRIHNDLLEIDLESIDFDINEISNILKEYRKKKRYYRLKNGQLIHLESNVFHELDSLLHDLDLTDAPIENGKIQLNAYRTLGLNERLKGLETIEVTRDESLENYIQSFEEHRTRIEVHPSYREILRDYQINGVKWLLTLYQYGLNGILADEMGLGKTLQVIALLDSIRQTDLHSIVVCPASLIYNWEDEINRFSDSLTCVSVIGTKPERDEIIKEYQNYDILITSYDYLRRDIETYQNLNFEYVILDEAQNIKNQRTKNAICVKQFNAKHRLALSGTPIENSLAELWSIFDFLMPDYLFSYPYFKTNFEAPITLNNDKEISKHLKSWVSPFILRRTKKEVLKELPDKVDHQYMIDFTPEEKNLYLANLAHVNEEMQSKIKDEKIDHIAILAMLTRLRQLCCDSRLLYDNIHESSSKVKACVELVEIMKEHNKKTLIFSSFTSLIDLLSKEFEQKGISHYILTGSTPKDQRRELVKAFQKDDTSVFLISLKAGGTGLNLTAAETVIHIDPWWNISAQNQATDRAHRIGQNANVQVYRMIMKDSIEEKILRMQEQKKDLADSFVEGNDGSLAKMSKDEIMDLFQR